MHKNWKACLHYGMRDMPCNTLRMYTLERKKYDLCLVSACVRPFRKHLHVLCPELHHTCY